MRECELFCEFGSSMLRDSGRCPLVSCGRVILLLQWKFVLHRQVIQDPEERQMLGKTLRKDTQKKKRAHLMSQVKVTRMDPPRPWRRVMGEMRKLLIPTLLLALWRRIMNRITIQMHPQIRWSLLVNNILEFSQQSSCRSCYRRSLQLRHGTSLTRVVGNLNDPNVIKDPVLCLKPQMR